MTRKHFANWSGKSWNWSKILSNLGERSPTLFARQRHILLTPAKTSELTQNLKERNVKSRKLENAICLFRNTVADKNQPAQKLHDATVNVARGRSIDHLMKNLDITESVPAIARDRRITASGRILQLQAECIMLADKFSIAQVIRSTPAGSSIKISGGVSEQLAKPFSRLVEYSLTIVAWKTCRNLV